MDDSVQPNSGTGSLKELAGDPERDFVAARSPLKILNHLDRALATHSVARRLGLDSTSRPYEWFQSNRTILERHQNLGIQRLEQEPQITQLGALPVLSPLTGPDSAGQTLNVLKELVANADRFGIDISLEAISDALLTISTAAQLEFHPTDVCNERCRGCTYGHDDPRFKPAPICFPFHELRRLAAFKPRTMVIAGGGEPLLYKGLCAGIR